jgi:very-short-patch-repair endonuclease
MPLRKLLQQIPNLLVRLKPCLLMSPLSVAQYLPAKGKRFDLVVFDEASQICTHDAIGAIGRGAQVVVVGDSKQLPPTAFFQRTAGEEDVADENDFAELESILDEAIAVGLPEQMLEWHYRSRHEALIDFSNQHYYDGRLNVFPAARGRVDDLGVKFHHVKDGVYDSGKSRTNEREARDLVAHLTASLRQTPPAARSFGIVTFSMAQQERVEELLNDARRDFPEIEPHFANNHPTNEAVFVKNLENVQGDERDEILFSIAYGTDTHGKKLMNFGPVNRDGGERRLNVAVTRARKQLRVFASITADWIDTSRARGRGAAHLKDFLRFAQQSDVGVRDDGEPDGDFDSDFERNVYDALRASGHRVRTQVGCGGYRIDLAVVHPEQPGVFALGVECDGAAYHSGATARDRDRLRQSVLEGLGWRMHRIWSTDWLYDREAELNRLLTAIDEAARGVPAEAPPVATGLTAPTEREAEEVATGPTTPRMPVTDVMPVVPYRRSQLATASADPEALYLAAYNLALRTAIEKVAYDEAPVHIDELGRRVLGAFGGTRLTPRVRKRIGDMVGALRDYAVVDDFVWPRTMDRTKYVSVRTAGPGEEARDAEAIPAEEVAAAAAWIMERAFSMSTAELITQTARVFGIKRVGQKVEERMMAGVQLLVRREICRETDARLTWVAR